MKLLRIVRLINKESKNYPFKIPFLIIEGVLHPLYSPDVSLLVGSIGTAFRRKGRIIAPAIISVPTVTYLKAFRLILLICFQLGDNDASLMWVF